MSFHHLDRWADVSSPLSGLAPVARLLGAGLIAVGSAVLPTGAWPEMAALALLVLALVRVARIPLASFALRVAAPLSFVLLASIGLLFVVPGAPLWTAGPLEVTDEGLLRFGSVLGRSFPALGAAVILVSTSRFTEVLEALRQLRLPHVTIGSLGLAYRLLYTLNDETERLLRGARSRNAGRGAASRRRLLVGITASTLARSFSRSERIHRAMLARGYTGALPALHARPLDRRSLGALAALGTVVLALAVFARV